MMKQQLNDIELDQVTGGTVCLSMKRNRVSFSTLKEGYDLKCTYKEASNLINQEFDAAPESMSERDFDTHVKQLMQSKGWI